MWKLIFCAILTCMPDDIDTAIKFIDEYDDSAPKYNFTEGIFCSVYHYEELTCICL